MKANKTNQSKSARKNSNAALASQEWYQNYVRHVELREILPRTRVTYLRWVRRLHEAFPHRKVIALAEGEVQNFIIALLGQTPWQTPDHPMPHCGAEMSLLTVINPRGSPRS